MQLLYLRTLLVANLCVMMSFIAQSQPNGNYGPKDIAYPIPSGSYYVSANGRGSVPCSKNNPCSLDKALSSAPSGTTIILRGGTYRTYNTKIPRQLTLQPYPGEHVTLKGSKVAGNWQKDGNSWKTSWTTLFDAIYNRPKYAIVTPENPMAAHQNMVFVNGSELQQVEYRSQVATGKYYVDYDNERVYIGNDPSGKTVEITAAQWGLHTYRVSAPDITIRGLEFQHYAETGIMMRSPRAVIEHCVFKNNAVAGVKAYVTNDTKIRNNLFHHNGLQGAGINRADNLILENNIFSENNYEKFNRNSWSAAGVKILRSPNSMVRNNLVIDNDANGIWLDDRSEGTFVINNEVRDNTRHGIHSEISHNTVVAGNLVTGCGNNTEGLVAAGICVGEASGVRVYNNTLVDNVVNLIVSDSERPEGELLRDTRNTIVKNNLMSNATGGGYPSAQVWVNMKDCGYTVVAEMDHNGYHKSDINHPDWLLRWKVATICSDEERHASLASVRQHFGFGKNSIELTGAEEPFFVNRSSGNYKIKEGSYAIKSGEALPSDIKSALGWNVSGSVDLGAYQSGYAKAAPAPTTGNLPWKEDFSLTNKTFVDDGMNGGTAWSLDRSKLSGNAIMEVRDSKLMATGTIKEGVWRSEEINITDNTVNFSMYIRSSGSLDPNYDYDYVKVFYKVDGGSEKLAADLRGNVSGKTISVKDIKGKTLQLVVRVRNSDRKEFYYIDNVNVEAASGTPSAPSAPSSPTASGNLPWSEQFNNGQDYKGSLETDNMYSYGSLEVSGMKITARGVGKAAWKSEVIELNGNTVDMSLVLSSLGKLEATHSYDAVQIYCRVDGGAEKLLKEVKGNISGYYKFVARGIEGENMQIIVRFKISDYTEFYFLDGVEVNIAGSATNRVAPTAEKLSLDAEEMNSPITEVAPDARYAAQKADKLIAYPNPTRNQLYVNFESSFEQKVQVMLMESDGEAVKAPVFMNSNEQISIDLNGLQPGIYMLQMLSEDGQTETRRIVKQ